MARPRNDRPNYVSVDIFRLRQIASTMDNESFGAWCRKALDDMSIGCVSEDVDIDVKRAYEDALTAMRKVQDRKRELHERKKASAASASTSTEVAPINGSKRNDQLVWGKFANVYLSQDEYNSLAKEFGNINLLNNVIESFSSSLADGNTKSQNHYATLTRWIATRKRWDAEKAEGKETFQEREGRRQVEQLKKFGLIK